MPPPPISPSREQAVARRIRARAVRRRITMAGSSFFFCPWQAVFLASFIGSALAGCKQSLTSRSMPPAKPPLHLLIAAPRGFCAGVDRAITIVEKAIGRYGPPVYVRHEIVHNRFVVDRPRGLGAV